MVDSQRASDVSAAQRTKGAQGEREAAALLTDLLGVPAIKRELSQTRDGGYDLLACGIAIEVKRTQNVGLDAALLQVDSAINERMCCDDEAPVLFEP